MRGGGKVYTRPVYQSCSPRVWEGRGRCCSVRLCHLPHLSGDRHWRARCRQRFVCVVFFFFLSFYFFMRQDQAQDVTLVSRTRDGVEKCLGKRRRNKWKLLCSRRKIGGRTGEKEKLKKKKKSKKDGLDLAGKHPPSFPGPWEAATVPDTGLLGPKVTCILSPSLIFTPVNTS